MSSVEGSTLLTLVFDLNALPILQFPILCDALILFVLVVDYLVNARYYRLCQIFVNKTRLVFGHKSSQYALLAQKTFLFRRFSKQTLIAKKLIGM